MNTISKHCICLYPQTKITLQVVYNEGVKIVTLLVRFLYWILGRNFYLHKLKRSIGLLN